jgi:hypothetical protein
MREFKTGDLTTRDESKDDRRAASAKRDHDDEEEEKQQQQPKFLTLEQVNRRLRRAKSGKTIALKAMAVELGLCRYSGLNVQQLTDLVTGKRFGVRKLKTHFLDCPTKGRRQISIDGDDDDDESSSSSSSSSESEIGSSSSSSSSNSESSDNESGDDITTAAEARARVGSCAGAAKRDCEKRGATCKWHKGLGCRCKIANCKGQRSAEQRKALRKKLVGGGGGGGGISKKKGALHRRKYHLKMGDDTDSSSSSDSDSADDAQSTKPRAGAAVAAQFPFTIPKALPRIESDWSSVVFAGNNKNTITVDGAALENGKGSWRALAKQQSGGVSRYWIRLDFQVTTVADKSPQQQQRGAYIMLPVTATEKKQLTMAETTCRTSSDCSWINQFMLHYCAKFSSVNNNGGTIDASTVKWQVSDSTYKLSFKIANSEVADSKEFSQVKITDAFNSMPGQSDPMSAGCEIWDFVSLMVRFSSYEELQLSARLRLQAAAADVPCIWDMSAFSSRAAYLKQHTAGEQQLVVSLDNIVVGNRVSSGVVIDSESAAIQALA